MSVELSPDDRAMLDGERGEAARLAMRIVANLAGVMEADRLIDVASAHVDGCLYHGPAGLEFAERLVAGGAAVSVPTTLNTGSLDLLHPELVRETPERARAARRQMDLYVAMGCRATWTCAPYQLPGRPSLGQQIAWAESNAIVFANSVLGARTNRYGDFIDICAAITGRVPYAGLHREENRRAEIVFRLSGISHRLLEEDVLYPVLGQLVGGEAGSAVVAIEGLPADTTEDRLKALGAAAASSGSVALFHAVGITPEAPTLEAALGGRRPSRTVEITPERLRAARDELSTTSREDLAAVSLGTPHFSLAEFEALMPLLDGVRVHPRVDLFISTGRDVLAEVERRGWLSFLQASGARIVTDTCTYITPIMRVDDGPVMTNSAKCAWYAPMNVGAEVVFGSLEECVRSAVSGRVWHDERLWADG
ncbi:MAG TPA: aconitase X catalytic domain-containing protein [Actinomycetota bacterium]|nr:aconitase X catalytic domain-containing protein [Actinomycetota bacterium]